MKWARPQAWNSGAAISVVSPARSGILDRMATSGSGPVGPAREAPFGVPVVPEVRMVWRPGSGGAGGTSSGASAIRDSSVGSLSSGPSGSPCQAT
jgi:hypothetical protein